MTMMICMLGGCHGEIKEGIKDVWMKSEHEILRMRQKLEESDRRQEDMSDCVGQATKPLLRQIETLQVLTNQS